MKRLTELAGELAKRYPAPAIRALAVTLVQRQADEQARQAREEAQRQAEEEIRQAREEARRQAEEQMRQARLEARQQAEEQLRREREETRWRAEEQRRRAHAVAQRQAEKEAQRREQEEARHARDAARLRRRRARHDALRRYWRSGLENGKEVIKWLPTILALALFAVSILQTEPSTGLQIPRSSIVSLPIRVLLLIGMLVVVVWGAFYPAFRAHRSWRATFAQMVIQALLGLVVFFWLEAYLVDYYFNLQSDEKLNDIAAVLIIAQLGLLFFLMTQVARSMDEIFFLKILVVLSAIVIALYSFNARPFRSSAHQGQHAEALIDKGAVPADRFASRVRHQGRGVI